MIWRTSFDMRWRVHVEGLAELCSVRIYTRVAFGFAPSWKSTPTITKFTRSDPTTCKKISTELHQGEFSFSSQTYHIIQRSQSAVFPPFQSSHETRSHFYSNDIESQLDNFGILGFEYLHEDFHWKLNCFCSTHSEERGKFEAWTRVFVS